MAEKNHRDDLVIEAFENAVKTRRPPDGLIFHSDGGKQFVNGDFRDKLKKHKMVQSMSRKGDPWDNAVAESFFLPLKDEEVTYSDYVDAENASGTLFSYIETLYNRKRNHYYLDCLYFKEFEKLDKLNAAQQADPSQVQVLCLLHSDLLLHNRLYQRRSLIQPTVPHKEYLQNTSF